MIPLGSGIQLLVDQQENPGVVIDIGSSIQAERPVSEAIEILETRYSDIQEFISTLQAEFDEIEEKVKQLANKFTEGAESLQSIDEVQVDESDDSKEQPPSKKRKRNISGELTLDD
jgi:prefoldin alpha subunit